MSNQRPGVKGDYYTYTGKNLDGEKESGMVFATSVALAKRSAAKRLLSVQSIFKDPVANIAWNLGDGYSKEQVARMFRVIGDNLERGSSLPESISLARLFVSDPYLRCACFNILDLMSSGKSLSAAMAASHFSVADCTIVASVRGGGGGDANQGGYANAFRIRAHALEFEAKGEKELNQALVPFIIFLIFIIVMVYILLFVMGKHSGDMLSGAIPKRNQIGFVGGYINFLQDLQENIGLYTTIYFTFGAGIIFPLFVKQLRYKMISFAFPSFSKFKLELDQYKTWQLWQLLRISGVDNVRIFALTAKIVDNPLIMQQNKAIMEQTRRGRGLAVIVRDVIKSARLREQLTSVLEGKSADKGMDIVLSLLQLQVNEYKNRAVLLFGGMTKGIVALALVSMMLMIIGPSFMLMANIN